LAKLEDRDSRCL